MGIVEVVPIDVAVGAMRAIHSVSPRGSGRRPPAVACRGTCGTAAAQGPSSPAAEPAPRALRSDHGIHHRVSRPPAAHGSPTTADSTHEITLDALGRP